MHSENVIDEEIEEIKEHTEKHYGVLPEINIQYSDKILPSCTILPLKWAEERLYEEALKEYNAKLATIDLPSLRKKIKESIEEVLALQEERLGIKVKVHPERYTIVLPTSTGICIESKKEYLKFVLLEQELKREKKEGPGLEIVRTGKDLCSFLQDHPKLWIYHCKWHEMGHVLAYSKNLYGFDYDYLNEGVAILYGFKGLLLGAQKGEFKIDEVKEMMKHTLFKVDEVKEMLKYSRANESTVMPAYDELERYDRAFKLVLRDFNPDFKSLGEAAQGIERGINRYVKREGNIQ